MGEDEEGPGLFQHTFPDSPEEYARNRVELLILQAQIQHGYDEMQKKYGDKIQYEWQESKHPEAARLHYGFVDAHRDLNLAKQRRKQK